MDTFLNISSNPAFAWTVTELVYDGRLFLPVGEEYMSYPELLRSFLRDKATESYDE